jgi:hypothetical protein
LGKHDGTRGRAFRRSYAALAERFDLSSRLAKLEAGRVAVAWVNLEDATQALEAARRELEGKRRERGAARGLERLARRQGLADASYSQALDKLRELVGPQRRLLGALHAGGER